MSLEAFKRKVDRREAVVAVLGLGYVGLPLAAQFAQAGFRVHGVDTDPVRVRAVTRGRSYIPDVPSEALAGWVRDRRLTATADATVLRQADAVSICVPTPLRKTRDPDISYILSALEDVKRTAHRDELIVLESTTYPGTTEEILAPALTATGLVIGRDLFLAFSPERIDPGNEKFTLANTPKVVGGVTARCRAAACHLYGQIIDRVVPVASPRSAEMVKLLENTFRAVNVALVNELALMCDRLGVDVWEVIDAAATKPFGFLPFYPGPGLGGHCIPVDPHYLAWKLKTLNYTARFIELAAEINAAMPEVVVRRIAEALNRRRKSLKGARVLVLGVAYKRDVSDTRESPAMDVLRLLKRQGARVAYHDPLVPDLRGDGVLLRSVPLTPRALARADAVAILTDHSTIDWRTVVRHAALVIDTRNATRGIAARTIVRL